MTENRTCEECGAELPANAPQGLCPLCLAKMGLGLFRTAVVPESDFQVERTGTLIGRYKLLEKIGEGGFGVVFMAEQVEPVQRKVALKIIKAGMDTKEVIARFEAERQAIALMDHPNIARALDAGATQAGRPYFVMELVRGIPITEYCDQNHLSTPERLQLFIKVCQAVQHAHQKGVIHRDLKPSNVLVTLHDGEPVPKVIDFGVAKALGHKLTEKTLFTAFHHMIGTPAYMSPEQAALSGLDIDTRADIYSLGVLLYELLTGVTPFDADTFRKAALDEIRRMIRETEPPKPSTRLQTLGDKLADVAMRRATAPAALGRLIRGDLDWIVMRCLEKDRKRRYETANGLAVDLARHLKSEPVMARPPSNLYRLQKLVRRHRLAFAAASAVAASLMIGLGVSTWLFLKERQARGYAVRAEGKARQAEGQTTEKLLESYLAQAHANRLTTRPGRRFDSLELINKTVGMNPSPQMREALRNEVIACLALTDARVAKQWEMKRGRWDEELCFDPQMKLYALGEGGYATAIHSALTDQEVARIPHPFASSMDIYAFSRNSRYLIAHSASKPASTYVFDIINGSPIMRFPGQDSDFEVTAMCFSPDSRFLAVSHRDLSLSLHTLDPSNEVHRVSVGKYFRVLRFHPDGNRLAGVLEGQEAVEIVEQATGRILHSLPMSGRIAQLAFSSDGRLLAACNDAGKIHVWDSLTGERRTLNAHEDRINTICFNHAGDLLASSSWDGFLKLWDVVTGRLVLSLPGRGIHLQFSPDDTRLAHLQGVTNVAVLEVAEHPEFRLFRSQEAGLGASALAFSRDGRLLAVATGVAIYFLDGSNGNELAALPFEHGRSVHFHPDGKSLIASGGPGLYQWNVEQEKVDDTNVLRLSSPQRLISRRNFCESALSADGHLVAVADGKIVVDEDGEHRETLVIDLQDASKVLSFGPQYGVEFVALSPDSRFVASGGMPDGAGENAGVNVWELSTQRLLRHLPFSMQAPLQSLARVTFSPDGRLLATSGQDYRLYDTGSWRLRFVLPVEREAVGLFKTDDLVFSPDGRILAIANTPHSVHLFSAGTGHRLAMLESPQPATLSKLAFSPDGTTLAVLQLDGHVQVWDLRGIRRRLAAMSLDWELPPYPPETGSESLLPVRVEVPKDHSDRGLRFGEFPRRDPQATSDQIDLSTNYNVALTWSGNQRSNRLATVPLGLRTFTGVTFDVRGIIQLARDNDKETLDPVRVDHVPVGRNCRRLHFLHAASRRAETGRVIGNYVIHYVNGTAVNVPIVNGQTLLDWWVRTNDPCPKGLTIAWAGPPSKTENDGTGIRLFQWTWENPSPGIEIRSFDFVSTLTGCAPLLFAVTAEY